jgi:very-short-patch-repair endonuclease
MIGSTVDIWARGTSEGKYMTYFQRGLLAAVLMLCGLAFWPLFFVGAGIAWTVYADIRDEPERKRQEAESNARLNETVTVEYMRTKCESPAETAFFDAMVSAYRMMAGPGCIAGDGIQLRTQIGLGGLRIGRGTAWSQFRGDFLIDDKLVVEIDGAKWHGSPDAIARDAARDEVVQAYGYTVLRIPAKVVFDTPAEAVRRVEEVRRRLTVAV